MQKGDLRMIYQDPVTRLNPEGPATLLRRIGRTDPDLGERWLVRFDDGDIRERWVPLDVESAAK